MTPEVAQSVLVSYQRNGPKFTSESARAILKAWLTSRAIPMDHYGNFKISDHERYHFSKTKLHHQVKNRGEWASRTSPTLIEAGIVIVKKAAEAANDIALAERLGGVKEKRKETRVARTEKSRADRAEAAAREHAVKIASAERPEEFVAWVADPNSEPGFGQLVQSLKQQAQEAVARGSKLSDHGIFSAAEPPLAPVLLDVGARWTENEGGVDYTVAMKHARGHGDTAAIHIGRSSKSGFEMAVDPLSHSVDWGEVMVTAAGDGYMSGWVARGPDGPLAGMFMLIAHEKKQGAGGRLLNIWCRMLDAYGIERWVAEAVGEEGVAFIAAKVKSGRLELLGAQGSSLLVRCVDPRQGRLALWKSVV